MRTERLSVLISAPGQPGRLGADAERRTHRLHAAASARCLRPRSARAALRGRAAGSPTGPACPCASGSLLTGCSAAAASPRCRRPARGGAWQYIATRPSRSPSIRCHSHSGRSVARRVRVQPRAQLEELAHAAGLRQGAVADVVLDVELVVLDPHPLAGGLDRPVRVLEEQRRDVLVLAPARRGRGRSCARPLGLLVQLQPADVHRHPAVLGHQEPERGRIERVHHPAILAGPRGPQVATGHARRPLGRPSTAMEAPTVRAASGAGGGPRGGPPRSLAVQALADRPVRARGRRRVVRRARPDRPHDAVLRPDRGGRVASVRRTGSACGGSPR